MPSVNQPPIQDLSPNDGSLLKGRKDILHLVDVASTAGSEWNRSAIDVLGLTEALRYSPQSASIADLLEFEDAATCPVDRAAVASSVISMTQATTVAGGRVDGGGGGGTGIEPIEAIFDSNTAKGHVVFISSAGHVDLAQANALSTSGAVGLANEAVTAGGTSEYVTEGPLTLDDWTGVAGTEFLTPGSLYYLDKTTAGRITTSAPADGGECVVVIGRATDATSLDIELSPPILLSGATEAEDSEFPLSATFDSAAIIGNVIYIKSDGHAELADASVTGTSGAVGLAVEVVAEDAVGHYVTDGQITRADWTSITGSEFLTPGSVYYLSLTAGQLTGTPPAVTGESIVIIGRALTETVFDIEINPPLLLS